MRKSQSICCWIEHHAGHQWPPVGSFGEVTGKAGLWQFQGGNAWGGSGCLHWSSSLEEFCHKGDRENQALSAVECNADNERRGILSRREIR